MPSAESFLQDTDFLVASSPILAQPVLLSRQEWRSYFAAIFDPSCNVRGPNDLRALVVNCLILLQASLFTAVEFSGCMGVTVHEVETSQFFTLVLDMDHGPVIPPERRVRRVRRQRLADNVCTKFCVPPRVPVILAVYPMVDCSVCSVAQVRGQKFWISWSSKLPTLDTLLAQSILLSYSTGMRRERQDVDPIERSWTPFCCRDFIKMHSRRLRKDILFQSLIQRNGSYPNVIYEVKTVKTHACLYDCRFFKLVDNEVVEVSDGLAYVTKIHAFKNYMCFKHDYWFSVDLFTNELEGPPPGEGAEGGAATGASIKRHKMRMSPFTRVDNHAVINRFFEHVGLDQHSSAWDQHKAAAVPDDKNYRTCADDDNNDDDDQDDDEETTAMSSSSPSTYAPLECMSPTTVSGQE